MALERASLSFVLTALVLASCDRPVDTTVPASSTPTVASAAPTGTAETPPMAPDIPSAFVPVTRRADHERREIMIPMRDGVKLFTVVMVPKSATHGLPAPIVLTRTPYDAGKRAQRSQSDSLLATLPLADNVLVTGGYIRVYQDVRGKYGSEGDYVMTRPLRGPLNGTPVDHSTDAYDTIDWLVKNVSETNGRSRLSAPRTRASPS